MSTHHGAARTGLRRAAVAVLVVLALGSPTAACTDDGDPTTAGPSDAGQSAGGRVTLPPPDGDRLPPDDRDDLADLYGPVLAEYGVQLTRGALIDRTGGGYERSPDGTHLALYVRPLASRTPAEYVTGIYELAALLSPDVFARWPGLESYDICQEDAATTEPAGAEVGALTQVELTREAAESFDWASGDLGTLIALSRSTEGVRVFARDEVAEDPAWRAAQQEADAAVGTTSIPRITATTVIPTPTTGASAGS